MSAYLRRHPVASWIVHWLFGAILIGIALYGCIVAAAGAWSFVTWRPFVMPDWLAFRIALVVAAYFVIDYANREYRNV